MQVRFFRLKVWGHGLLAAALLSAMAVPSFAQQISGTPGSPSATTMHHCVLLVASTFTSLRDPCVCTPFSLCCAMSQLISHVCSTGATTRRFSYVRVQLPSSRVYPHGFKAQ